MTSAIARPASGTSDADAAGDGEPADSPGAGSVQRVEQAGHVPSKEAHRLLVGTASGKVHDVLDGVTTAERQKCAPIRDVEGLDGVRPRRNDGTSAR